MTIPDDATLKLDYEKTLAAVDKFDNYLLQIQSWAVVSCGAVLAYGVENKSIAIASATVLISGCFDFVAHIYKAFQIDAMNHAYTIETLLQPGHPDRAKAENTYEFGVGHAIRPITKKSLLKVWTHPLLWHFRSFFFLLVLLAVIADIWILHNG